MRRQYGIKEALTRDFHRKKRKTIAKCEELGIKYYEIGKNDEKLYENPNNFVCIQSSNEMNIGDPFIEGIENESIFISIYDYESSYISEAPNQLALRIK